MTELRPSEFLKAVAHGFHTKHQKSEGTYQLKNYPNRHKKLYL